MNIFISSDLHLGHKNAVKWREGFNSSAHHDAVILQNHIEILDKRKIWICCGDVAFTKEALESLKQIVCHKKILILGNHCTERGLTVVDFMEVFDEIHGLKSGTYNGKKYWLSHAPIHPNELRGKVNIHGHSHKDVMGDDRYINVCLEHTNYRPVYIGDLLKCT
ncbi:putative serine/threonine protein phosphatase [Trabzonvirus APT65]|uniref:Serine/threonine protein phosphatase n=1 Tax=Aeromonas phage APT65 TaxID=2982914 RepID=A0A9E8GAB4_9CAUD|nr:putative serine/threonine protein phosphatase [Aeromonas phage APT65]